MYYCLLERQKFPTFDCDKLGQCDQCKRYQRGGHPPKHPMPAIVSAAYIGKYEIVLLSYSVCGTVEEPSFYIEKRWLGDHVWF